MNQLDRDIKHLEGNLKHWHSLYDNKDLARANRMLNYMRQLKNKKGEQQ